VAAAVQLTSHPTPDQLVALQEILHLLPKSEPWEKWVQATGTAPPDFATLPNIPFLPDPLRSAGGKEVKRENWPRRRAELLAGFQEYITGSWPPSPGNTRLAEQKQREEGGAIIQEVVLEFGPRYQARLHVEILVPKGEGPFPVFLTQDTHRRWALIAVSRGYIGCVYAGADSRDDTEAWKPLWPGQDWTKLTRRAWAASRCIDYLHTLPFVQTNQIALTGHSRNGKTSLIGAAFDHRVNAVISSSSGAGGACSYRLFSETQFGEGIENITRAFPDWLHPRLRFFAGRENKLPVDQPELIACIAPRPCLISSALNDSVESIWAVEHTYHSARRVYELLGKPNELNLRYRPGGHETRAQDIEAYLDWLDSAFGRKPYALPDCVLFPTYDDWLRASGEVIDPTIFTTNGLGDLMTDREGNPIKTIPVWRDKRDKIRERILWALGEAPPFAESEPGAYGGEASHQATLLGRATPPPGVAKRSINFGNYVAGDLYYPTNAERSGRKLPVVIWLHPISVSDGYTPGYKRGENPHAALARTGCAVFAFDQIGNGTRIEEVRNFYERYPHWSLLGKQVEDTLAAVEALGKLEIIEPRRIWLLGYGPGAMTALYAAALNERIAGVLSVAGFTPMRSDTLDKGTGGVARWSRWLPLLPKLGAFVAREDHIPYDYHEVLAMIAPRPVVVFVPKLDFQAVPSDVKACVEDSRRAYDLFLAKPMLEYQELDDYNHFSPETQQVVFAALRRVAGY
jgi:dienelactone hydrolase